MEGNVIFQNEYLKIYNDSGNIYIETYKRGFPMEQLNDLFSNHPEIGITSYAALRNAINSNSCKHEKFGELKKKIVIDCSKDELTAFIVFNMPKAELGYENRENLIREATGALSQSGISHGIRKDIFNGEIRGGKQYVIAEGLPPVNGKDSIARMYELQESKPDVREDGHADFYDMKLINRVRIGDWLGERLDATIGVSGVSVKGAIIKAISGKTFPLEYDRNSVCEIYEDGKTTLYSKLNGAVNYQNGKITVSNHLEIEGDVGISTGNVRFDGYVTIKGTIADGFTVEATKDIEVNGELGVGSPREIISTGGSVFIKGGISSKGKTEIRAQKNVYVKFIENTSIKCNGCVHLGFYCINSEIAASEVVIESINGHLIGGRVNAEIRVSIPIVGSEFEKKTIIEVSGFSRAALFESFEKLIKRTNELKIEQQKLKLQMALMEENRQMDQFQKKQYTDMLEKVHFIKDEIKGLDEERKNIAAYLKARGEGEISVTKKIYPNCTLIIRKNIMEITTASLATVYYVQDDEIKQA